MTQSRTVKLAARIQIAIKTLFLLWLFIFVRLASYGQGVLPSQWVFDPITAARAVAYSPNGKFLALAGDGGVQIWSVSTNTMVTCLPTSAAQVFSVTFSPDGHTLALGGNLLLYGGGGPVIEIWNFTTGKFIRSMTSQSNTVYSVAFTPDGKQLAVGGWDPANLAIWDVATGRQTALLPTALYSVDCLQFSSSGAQLVAGGYGNNTGIEIWDVTAGKLLHALKSATTEVYSVSLTPDGKTLASGGFAFTSSGPNLGVTEIWDVHTGMLIASPNTNSETVDSVAYSPDGKTLAISSGRGVGFGSVGLWDAATSKFRSTLVSNPWGMSGALAFSPNGKSITVFGNLFSGPTQAISSQFVSWDLATGNQTAAANLSPYIVASAVAYSPDGKTIVVGGANADYNPSGGWLGIFDADSHQLEKTLSTSVTNGITSVAISGDGTLLADAGNYGLYGSSSIEIWNIATGKLVTSISTAGRGPINKMAFSPQGAVLAVASGNPDIQLWDAATGALAGDFVTEANSGITSIAFSPDGNLLIAGGSKVNNGYQVGVLEVWDAVYGVRMPWIQTTLYSVMNVAFSHDGKTIADGGLRYFPSQNNAVPGIEIWNAPFWSSTLTFIPMSESSYPATSLAFSLDDSILLASDRQGIQMFGMSKQNLLASFEVGPINQIVVSPTTADLAYTMFGQLAVTPVPSFGSNSIAGLALNPSEVAGGAEALGTVTLTHPAPPSGIDVNLSSSDPGVVVPSSVTVPGGETTASFSIVTSGVNVASKVSITAQAGAYKKSATLKIDASKMSQLQIDQATISGGNSDTVWVYLTGPAGPNGAIVSIKSSSAVVTVPQFVKVESGYNDTYFSASTSVVASPTKVILTATYGSVSKTVQLTVTPPGLSRVYVFGNDLPGGSTAQGTVELDGPAPSGGATIKLLTNSTAAAVPSSVTIPAGQTAASFTVTTSPVATKQTVTLTAKLGLTVATTTFSVVRPALGSISLNPTSVQGGQTSKATVTIGSPAPVGGLVISLSSNIPAATVPNTVTIPAGAASVTFTVHTSAVPSTTGATIRASLGNATVSAVLSIS